jgi:hypothetical protein
LFTQAVLNPESGVNRKNLILSTTNRIPLFQVEVSLRQDGIVRVVEIPQETIRWSGFPTPIY